MPLADKRAVTLATSLLAELEKVLVSWPSHLQCNQKLIHVPSCRQVASTLHTMEDDDIRLHLVRCQNSNCTRSWQVLSRGLSGDSILLSPEGPRDNTCQLRVQFEFWHLTKFRRMSSSMVWRVDATCRQEGCHLGNEPPCRA